MIPLLSTPACKYDHWAEGTGHPSKVITPLAGQHIWQTHIQWLLDDTINLTCMFLSCGRKIQHIHTKSTHSTQMNNLLVALCICIWICKQTEQKSNHKQPNYKILSIKKSRDNIESSLKFNPVTACHLCKDQAISNYF